MPRDPSSSSPSSAPKAGPKDAPTCEGPLSSIEGKPPKDDAPAKPSFLPSSLPRVHRRYAFSIGSLSSSARPPFVVFCFFPGGGELTSCAEERLIAWVGEEAVVSNGAWSK